jgi:predicted secreted hydrolase
MRPVALILVLFLSLAAVEAKGVEQATPMALDYPQITGPCNLSFPRDHGPHPDYKTEWWYYTGNLRSDSGERFGFQLTFFRSRFSPPGAEQSWPNPKSAWRTEQLFLAHAALTDIDGKQFYHDEQAAREAMGMSGALQEAGSTVIFLRDWLVKLGPEEHSLRANTKDFALDLTARPEKPPVLHGESGYSLKGSTPERSSCYYSFTRFQTRGVVTVKGKAVPVVGTAWMDHEFSSAPLEPGITGWDWFSLQLADGTDLMIYLLRLKEGSFHSASSGSYVAADGRVLHLTREDLDVEVLDEWKSPHSGARYPSRWKIVVYPRQMTLTVTPNLPDQEMQTPETTGVTYWEGSVSVNGSVQGQPASGFGYVELTGYEKPFDAPM